MIIVSKLLEKGDFVMLSKVCPRNGDRSFLDQPLQICSLNLEHVTIECDWRRIGLGKYVRIFSIKDFMAMSPTLTKKPEDWDE